MTEQKNAGSVLAAMSQGVRDIAKDKTAQGQGLTPVALEPRMVLPGVAFPNDMPKEVMEEAARDIERTIRHLQDALLALRSRVVVTEETPVKLTAIEERLAGKDPEPEPEAPSVTPVDFAEDFAAKVEAAKAATFSKPATGEWQCPVHGAEGVAKTSPAGRNYIGCPTDGCKKFRKEDA